jgi:hypothetical protein
VGCFVPAMQCLSEKKAPHLRIFRRSIWMS